MKAEMTEFTDYFLRYSASVPTEELELHKPFLRDCKCKPEVDFDKENGWHLLKHKNMGV